MTGDRRVRRHMRWLKPWLAKGYTVEHGSSGHYKVRAPGGEYVASVSGTPRTSEAPRFEVERLLRRHEEASRMGDERGNDDE